MFPTTLACKIPQHLADLCGSPQGINTFGVVLSGVSRVFLWRES